MKKLHKVGVDVNGVTYALNIIFHDFMDRRPDPAAVAAGLIDALNSEFSDTLLFRAKHNDGIDYLRAREFDAVISVFENYFFTVSDFYGVPDIPGIYNAYLFHCYITE